MSNLEPSRAGATMANRHLKNSTRAKKPAETELARRYSGRGIARISLVFSTLAIILVLFLLPRVLSSDSSDSNTAPNSETVVCPPGLSAYQVWLSVGNVGSAKDFVASLVGEKGADGFDGSDGFSGADGASAYQIWLDAGNTGSSQVFLDSLAGKSGPAGQIGPTGYSAYQLWLLQGNSGTESDFLKYLVGPKGDSGQSAYELWLEQDGNEGKTESEFLISLVGEQGPAGVDGICSVGDTGPAGPPGAVSGFGYSGSWHDISDQRFGSSGPKAALFGVTDYEYGISMVDGSKITFGSAGTYDIQFSAQLSFPGGGKDQTVNIWIAKNGESVPNSNTRVIVPGSNEGYTVAAWNFFVNVQANDYVQLIWSASDSDVEILHEEEVAGTGLYQPGIPSIILTVNQVYGPEPQ